MTEASPHANVTPAGEAALARAGELLRERKLVAFPTETVYGLGANARDERAVAGIFEAKGRPHFDPLIVHLARAEDAWPLAATVPSAAARLAEAFWPGPLTLVLPRCRASERAYDAEAKEAFGGPKARRGPRTPIPDLVTAGRDTVALRVPGHPVARALIEAAQRPVAAPSANRFGGISPTRAEHVAQELGNAAALILDGGPCETGVESTVIGFTQAGRPRVLRMGGVALESIEQIAGAVETGTSGAPPHEAEAGRAAQAPEAPGMLSRHYAPSTRLTLWDAVTSQWLSAQGDGARRGVLLFRHDPALVAQAHSAGFTVEVLSPAGDMREAAANLFSALRRLDAAGVDAILAERAPEESLGRAINDRLQRAAK